MEINQKNLKQSLALIKEIAENKRLITLRSL